MDDFGGPSLPPRLSSSTPPVDGPNEHHPGSGVNMLENVGKFKGTCGKSRGKFRKSVENNMCVYEIHLEILGKTM